MLNLVKKIQVGFDVYIKKDFWIELIESFIK